MNHLSRNFIGFLHENIQKHVDLFHFRDYFDPQAVSHKTINFKKTWVILQVDNLA